MSSTNQHELHMSPRTQPPSRVGMTTPSAADGHGANASVPWRCTPVQGAPVLSTADCEAAAPTDSSSQTDKQALPSVPSPAVGPEFRTWEPELVFML